VVKKNVVRVEHHQHSVAGPFSEYLQALTKLGRSKEKEVRAALRSVLQHVEEALARRGSGVDRLLGPIHEAPSPAARSVYAAPPRPHD
jgi:hypothetical protein